MGTTQIAKHSAQICGTDCRKVCRNVSYVLCIGIGNAKDDAGISVGRIKRN